MGSIDPETTTMPAFIAILGILLIVIAIPFGLMLAPLALGAGFVWYSLGRLDAAVASPRAS